MGACTCALGASAAPALAYPTFYVSFTAGDDAASVSVYDVGSSNPLDTHQLKLMRDGTEVASTSGNQYQQLPLAAGALHAGDQAVEYRNGVAVTTSTYDGTPTVAADAACGASQFTGAASAGELFASVYTPANGSGTNHNVTLSRTAGGYLAALDTPLLAGDRITMHLSTTSLDGTTATQSYREATVACPAAPVTPEPVPQPPAPGPAPAPGPITPQILLGAVNGGLNKQLVQLAQLSPASVLTTGGTTVLTQFFSPGTMGYVWTAPAPPHVAAAARSIVVAKGSLTRSTPGMGKVKVRLTKGGKALLRRSRSVKLTIRGTFTPLGGTPVAATKKVTLKRHVKKHH